MPEAARHREQCERNARAYQTLGGEQARFLEWPITTLFYIAVHLAEEYLARSATPLHSSGHKQRYQWLAQRAPVAAAKFKILYDASRTARYDCVFTHFSEGDVLRLRDLAVKEVPRELGVDAVKL
ncbi:MAG: hypothetical protein WCP98_06875 [Actinomycetes bacterium]